MKDRLIKELKARPCGAWTYTALCPFHREKTPSFIMNFKHMYYHCFGCSAHGELKDLVGKGPLWDKSGD